MQKDDPRTEAYGSTDEAVAAIGLARSFGCAAPGLDELLLQIQRELFVVGAELATDKKNTSKLKPGVSKVTEEMVRQLEEEIDRMTSSNPLPEYFVVPGSSTVSAALDLARAVVRRAERAVVRLARDQLLADDRVIRYVNRLSDFLFVAARYEEAARGEAAPPSRQ